MADDTLVQRAHASSIEPLFAFETKLEMKRRDFLTKTALTVAALQAHGLNALAVSDKPLKTRARKRVIVLGAGLSGLSAAYQLTKADHDVTILEARTRAGGRVHTLREPFADGLHAEAGAMFIPESHSLVMRYVKLFRIPLIPVPHA